MFALKSTFLSVFLVIILINNIKCGEDKIIEEEQNQNENKTKSEEKIGDENYDEIGEKFMSLLSEKVRMKILKNKAANEGILDPAKFKKEFLTKEELEEVQAALVTAMQPLFGQFVSELGMGPEDEEKETLELDGPTNATKKSAEDKVDDKKSKDSSKKDDKKPDKKMPKKKEDIKEKKPEKKQEKVAEKADKPKSKTEKDKTGKDEAKKPTRKSEKEKKDTVKDKKKPDKTKEKKDTKKKEEL